jgi:hypothetical protein
VTLAVRFQRNQGEPVDPIVDFPFDWLPIVLGYSHVLPAGLELFVQRDSK